MSFEKFDKACRYVLVAVAVVVTLVVLLGGAARGAESRRAYRENRQSTPIRAEDTAADS